MDILNTEVVWVEGRCYRKLPIKTKTVVEPVSEFSNPRKTDCDITLPIKHEGNRFFITLPLPASLIGFVQGKQGQRRKTIEGQTNTTITIPPARKTDNKDVDINIAIFGRTKEDVASAYNRIEGLAKEARWKQGDYTHFISVPVNDPSIQERFNNFKKEILTKYRNVQGISEGLFEPAPKLHLTIAMLTLLNSREKETAASLLKKHKTDIINLLDGKSLRLEVKGIEYMNDDPSEVDVLYGMVRETDSDNCLQLIADKLANAFAIADLSRGENREHVKLHVTLMKSRTVEDMGRITFDARKILQDYADYTFGQMTIKEIHISVRFTGGKESYYTYTDVLKI